MKFRSHIVMSTGSPAASSPISPSAARRVGALLLLGLVVSCSPRAPGAPLSASERNAISATLRARITQAYDLSSKDVVGGLTSLYPESGPVISATAGNVTTSRDTLVAGIRSFWLNVGRNMRDPKWEWGPMFVTALAPDAAVLTTTYRVPHLTPDGRPHVIAGAWTAVFQKQGGRWVVVQEHLSDRPPVPGT